MTAIAHCYGFEPGHFSAFGTRDFLAGFFNQVFASTAAARSGLYGLEFDTSVTSSPNRAYSIRRQYPADPSLVHVRRYYCKMPSLPGSAQWQLGWMGDNNADQARVAVYYDGSDGLLHAARYNSSDVVQTSAAGPSIAADEWVRIDELFDQPNATFEWSVDGDPQTGIGTSTFVPTFDGFGKNVDTASVRIFIDDISVVHTVAGDDATVEAAVRACYPIGEGYVLALRPNASGTHNDGGVFSASSGTLADSWQLLDDAAPWLGGATDTVQQDSIETTKYLEYEFEALPGGVTPIRGVMTIGEIRQAGASANNVEVHTLLGALDYKGHDGLWFGGPAIQSINAGVETTAPSVADVNAIKVRWGYSDDVIAVPILGALMVEVDVVAEPPVERGLHGALELNGLVLPVRATPQRYRSWGSRR